MKTKQISLILLGVVAATPLTFTSCSHPVAAGAAGAAAYNKYDEEKKKDDLENRAKEKKENRDR